MKVNGKDDNPYIMENKKCLKPPTSYKQQKSSRTGSPVLPAALLPSALWGQPEIDGHNMFVPEFR